MLDRGSWWGQERGGGGGRDQSDKGWVVTIEVGATRDGEKG